MIEVDVSETKVVFKDIKFLLDAFNTMKIEKVRAYNPGNGNPVDFLFESETLSGILSFYSDYSNSVLSELDMSNVSLVKEKIKLIKITNIEESFLDEENSKFIINLVNPVQVDGDEKNPVMSSQIDFDLRTDSEGVESTSYESYLQDMAKFTANTEPLTLELSELKETIKVNNGVCISVTNGDEEENGVSKLKLVDLKQVEDKFKENIFIFPKNINAFKFNNVVDFVVSYNPENPEIVRLRGSTILHSSDKKAESPIADIAFYQDYVNIN